MTRVQAIWPARKDWQPGGNWRQDKRWLVLDVTAGLDNAKVLARCYDRAEACSTDLKLRADAASRLRAGGHP